MARRALFLCFLAVLGLLAACAAPGRGAEDGAARAVSAPGYRQQLAAFGRLERQRMDVPENAPTAVRGRTFSISAQELDALSAEYQLAGSCTAAQARAMARRELTEKYALYSYASARGFSVDETALDALLADEQDFDGSSAADRQAFLQGFGGDEALYWSLRREDLRIYATIDLFRESCRSAYQGDDFPACFAALTEQILAGEQIVFLS